MRYINYARKSSDEKSRKQVQSIPDQLKDTRRLARERDLNVAEEMTESRTAKEPGRPVFNAMIEKIQKGEADAILCWKLDRLSRNSIDAGMLRWLMRKRKLLEIQTPHQIYSCDDNAVIAAVESAMAEQYIVDLEKHVHRSMTSKCEEGGYPLLAPSGYRNNPLERTVDVDPERFALLRKAWELLLTGDQTVPQIREVLVNEWGYRGRITKSSPTGRVTTSALYHIFNNTFYMGAFRFQGKTYLHKFPRMVSKAEFDLAQAILQRRGAKKPVRHAFAFTGLMTCASCGFYVTAEKAKGHTYYHCNNRLGLCSKKGIREEEITRQIDDVLESVSLPPAFESLAHKILDDLQQEEQQSVEEISRSREGATNNLKRQKEALLSLYLQGHLDADEYAAKKDELVQQETDLKLEGEAGNQNDEVDRMIKKVAHHCVNSKSLFQTGDAEQKRSVARHLGSYTFNNGQLQIELHEIFAPVRSQWKKWENEIAIIEPLDIGSRSWKTGDLEPVVTRWQTSFIKYRTFLRERKLALRGFDESGIAY